ncbi:acetylxylan esterase, partial [Escherichia coli]|nr:acetylxylan esterase [Escherichia coli]
KDWARRRSEIVARFDREIYGRVPLTAPKIRWNLVREEKAVEAGMPVVKRWLEGVADNRARPQASATLAVRYTLPAGRRRVPVMLSFGFPEGFRFPGPPRPADPGPPPGEQLLRRGWG